jgi:hypothetical protein
MLISCLAYSSTLKMKAKSSSEILVDLNRAARRYIPEEVFLVTALITCMEHNYSSCSCSCLIFLKSLNYFPYLNKRRQNAVFTSNSFVLKPSPWVVLCIRKQQPDHKRVLLFVESLLPQAIVTCNLLCTVVSAVQRTYELMFLSVSSCHLT